MPRCLVGMESGINGKYLCELGGVCSLHTCLSTCLVVKMIWMQCSSIVGMKGDSNLWAWLAVKIPSNHCSDFSLNPIFSLAPKFWMSRITHIHFRQFSVISCLCTSLFVGWLSSIFTITSSLLFFFLNERFDIYSITAIYHLMAVLSTMTLLHEIYIAVNTSLDLTGFFMIIKRRVVYMCKLCSQNSLLRENSLNSYVHSEICSGERPLKNLGNCFTASWHDTIYHIPMSFWVPELETFEYYTPFGRCNPLWGFIFPRSPR